MAGISHGTTDQAAMDFSTKTIFMSCMKALNISLFLGCACICTNQHNKSLFSNSFIIFLLNNCHKQGSPRAPHKDKSKIAINSE